MAVLFARGDAQGEAGGLDYEEIAIGGELAGMSIAWRPSKGQSVAAADEADPGYTASARSNFGLLWS
ncbi:MULTISPECIES: hypothetical protein [Sinorhizobium]|uniref:Uncharacterized protein n=2 Tax=Sinorhizobium TaxID=28105 RepID=A0A2S3YUX1_9HYPH|nr:MULTISPECIES: hypothetical protein [Sinorhizobium]AUX77525.1 hypothetical protein NXT3_CH02970 [Sinorhizobium fredii]PDT39489.1 hypothetical protein CO656_21870 [Sinorhizobium sp. FG01]POH35417.1 hypothetical protein ATY31_02865 [Sinorhizobium americanum]